MNNIRIYPTKLSGSVEIASSKSVAHRMMICAGLSSEQTTITSILKGTDVVATANAITALGGNVEISECEAVISPVGEVTSEPCEIYLKDSGSTFRFMLPVCGALGKSVTFSGTERLASRPVAGLSSAMKNGGITFSGETLPFEITGKLQAGRYEIDASVSSQYVTGLLLALASLDSDSELILSGDVVSSDYINITLDVMKMFAVEPTRTESGFILHGEQKFISPASLNCEGDWSSACFLAVAGGIAGGIAVENVFENSLQGDREILNFLDLCGASHEKYINEKNADCFKIETGKLTAGKFFTSDTPDCVPVLAVLCAYCTGTSEIVGVSRLKDKESDRLTETINMLSCFGIKAYSEGDSLFVEGGMPKGGVYHAPDDHRMAMAAVILATYAGGTSEVYGMECISKSYPHFLSDYEKLGGKFDVLL